MFIVVRPRSFRGFLILFAIGLLPLHLAGHAERGAGAKNRVISSANFRRGQALIYRQARRRGDERYVSVRRSRSGGAPNLIVPTLCVGMPDGRSASRADAERLEMRHHAERGNDQDREQAPSHQSDRVNSLQVSQARGSRKPARPPLYCSNFRIDAGS
jgi:hypothetical protein